MLTRILCVLSSVQPNSRTNSLKLVYAVACKGSTYTTQVNKVAWPSGLRRWFKAPVTKVAWVRIPPLPIFFFLPYSFTKASQVISTDFYVLTCDGRYCWGSKDSSLVFPCHVANFLCMWPGNEASGTTIQFEHNADCFPINTQQNFHYFKGVIKDSDK